MNIEENIKPLKILMSKYKQIDEMNNFDHELALVIDYTELSAIETLLTAYEKEKEKNKRLEKFIENGEHTWKQKYNETFKYVEDEFVSKDKIRLKMKQEMDKGYRLSEERHLQNYVYDRLKELLEE